MYLCVYPCCKYIAGVQARGEASEWQDKWQQAVKELADVKERAWTLLEEKDLQLQSLKVTTPHTAPTHNCNMPTMSACHMCHFSMLP